MSEIDEFISTLGLPTNAFTEEWWLCRCRFKGSSANPILTSMCDYHKRKLRSE